MEDIWLKVLEVFQLDKNTFYCLCCIGGLNQKFIGLMNSDYCFQLYFHKVCVTSFSVYEL